MKRKISFLLMNSRPSVTDRTCLSHSVIYYSGLLFNKTEQGLHVFQWFREGVGQRLHLRDEDVQLHNLHLHRVTSVIEVVIGELRTRLTDTEAGNPAML